MVGTYRISEFKDLYCIYRFGVTVAENIKDKKTAEFICRACNAHYDLLAACKSVLGCHRSSIYYVHSQALEDAIVKAKEEK